MPFDHHAEHMRQMQDQHRRQQQQMQQLQDSQRRAQEDAQRWRQWQDDDSRRRAMWQRSQQRRAADGTEPLETGPVSKAAVAVLVLFVAALVVGGVLLVRSAADSGPAVRTGDDPTTATSDVQPPPDFTRRSQELREKGKRDCLASGAAKEVCEHVYGR